MKLIYSKPQTETISVEMRNTLCASDPTQQVSFGSIPGEGEGL